MPTDYLVCGAGGHAKVVLDALARLRREVRVADDDPRKHGSLLLDRRIEAIAPTGPLPRVHLAIGDNSARQRLFERLASRVEAWFDVVHPESSIAAGVALGAGSFVAAQAVVGPDAVLGEATIVNHGAVADHDCRLGACCHLAPNATLGGAVELGDRVLVGAGAVVLPGLRIADDAVIGAGAVVTRDVAAGQVVRGVPAEVRE